MSKRRTDDEVTRLLKDADRGLAKGLTVSDFYRKVGVAQTTYHRWRQRHDPARVDSDRRCRQLEGEVERLKRLVAELLVDKQMLQDVAKKVVTLRQEARERRTAFNKLETSRRNPAGSQSRPVELGQRPEASLAWWVGNCPCEA